MERAEFERLAMDQLDAVYRMALQLTRSAEEAEDLVQDVYVRAFDPRVVERFESRPVSDARRNGTADESDPGSGMRSWLFTIAHHTFYSKMKRRKQAPTAVGEFYGVAADGPLPDAPPPAWDLASLDWEQVDGKLKRAVEGLRPEFRQVLLMWGVEGLKYRQIAEILEVPLGTVMSRLHRARKILSDELGGESGAIAAFGVRGATDAASEGAES